MKGWCRGEVDIRSAVQTPASMLKTKCQLCCVCTVSFIMNRLNAAMLAAWCQPSAALRCVCRWIIKQTRGGRHVMIGYYRSL